MATTPFWHDPPAPRRPPLDRDLHTSVCVVGAGLCGSSATLALAQAGIDVVQLEAGAIAGSASGRNAGFILQGTAERYDRACAVLGRERARRVHAYSLENHDRMAAFVRDHDVDCGYRRAGSLQLAGSDREEGELADSAALLVEDGFEAQLLHGADLPAVYRDAGWNMGVLLPRDGEVHPARLVQAAVAAAEQAGAAVYEQTPVTAIDARGAGDVRVETAGGTVHCDVALVCTNAAVGRLLPWFADKVDPVRGQMLATAPAPPLFERPVYADHGYDYWRQDPATGRVVLGGWRNLDPDAEVGHADVLHDEIQARMDAFLHRFTALRDVPVTHRWSGTMGFSRDGLPLVGAAPGANGVLVGAGFTGHGFGFAWLAGHALAQVALEGRHPFADELPPRRFA
ncbi:MAG: FAD-binding oxidoreductase [Alphaproteobacteria bacterium]|nr:FAD-binding oxidoreductase [Alphaproteobacteria bacterium]